MILRPYQERVIAATRLAVQRGARKPLVVMPTGAGKTVVVAAMARGRVERKGRVVWLAHRSELVSQAADTLRRLGLDVGARGERAAAPVQVTTVQTILARGEAPPGDMLVLDEAHHFVAPEFSRVAAAYPDAIVVGATATPERGDGVGLHGMFDHLVIGPQISELIQLGALVPCEVHRPSRALKAGQIAQMPVDAYCTYSPGGRAVVFAPNLEDARRFSDGFTARGIKCGVVDYKMPVDERAMRLAAFARGDLRVLCNVMILTEGWDCPPADTCILARGCGSIALYIQMAGRVLRAAPGKSSALVLDLRGVSHAYGEPTIDREYSLDGRGISRPGEMVACSTCRVCGANIEPGEACGECGTAPREQIVSEATGEPLEKFAWKRAETIDKRVATLARWLAAGAEKGHKPGAARYKFKAVYGHFPTADVMAVAEQIARAS